MKRNLILASLLALPFLASPALAQDRGYSLGVALGMNFPATDVSTRALMKGDVSDSTGVAGGIHFEGRLGRNWTIVSQVLYVRRETEVTFAGGGGAPETRSTYTFDMLEVPYHLKYSFGMGQKVQPYLFGGGSVGFTLNADGEHVSSGAPAIKRDESDAFDGVNWALEGGAGISFNIGDGKFFYIDGRYIYGLSNFAAQNGDTWKTRDFRLMAGLLFGL